MARLVVLALVAPVLCGWTHPGESIFLLPLSAQLVQESVGGGADADADRNMVIGRYYVARGDNTGAINRFKTVVLRFPASQHVEEALARLTEAYLALGVASEAQTTAAVLACKFPNSHWSAYARAALRSAGLEPIEDQWSCGRSFK